MLISALWIVVILRLAAPAHALQQWYDVPTGVLFLCRATCVPAGGLDSYAAWLDGCICFCGHRTLRSEATSLLSPLSSGLY